MSQAPPPQGRPPWLPPGQPPGPPPGPPPPGWPGGPPPPRRRRSRTGLIILAVLGVFGLLFAGCIAVLAVGVANAPDTTEPAAEPPPATEPAETETTAAPAPKPQAPAAGPGIGDPVRDGHFEFTVGKPKQQASYGEQPFQETAQGVFWLVPVTVRNIGNEARTLEGTWQYGYDDGGRRFEATSAIFSNDQAFLEDINPGNKVATRIVFDVPKGTKLTRLELHDSPFSGGVRVDLR
jgi:hypothetical protein